MTDMTMLARSGIVVTALATAAMGGLELVRGEALPGLHPLPEGVPEMAARVLGAWLALSALALLVSSRIGAWANAACWAAALLLILIGPVAAEPVSLAWVQVAQAVVLAVLALTCAGVARDALRFAFGAMLVLFGAIHLANVAMIASLIPDWMPFALLWPYVTGAGQVAAGLACIAGRGVRFAAIAVAAMYLLWLPLVHAARIVAAPESVFEWTFALMAVALAGVALVVAGGSPRPVQQA